MSCINVGDIKLEENKLKFIWTIENAKNTFNNKKIKEYIISPPIIDGDQKWYIHLYPSGRNEKLKDYVSIYLVIYQSRDYLLKNKYFKTIMANYQFSILNNKNEIEHSVESSLQSFTPKEQHSYHEFSDGGYYGNGWSNFIEKKVLFKKSSNLIDDNGNLRILLIIHKNNESFDILKKDVADNSENLLSESQLFNYNNNYNNFEVFLNNELYSDVKLIVKGKIFYAHKIVLASKSLVFMNIFDNNKQTKDKKIQITTIEINDIESDVIQDMLNFIYLGKIDDINNKAIDLLTISSKYQINELKEICEVILIKEVNVNNSIDMLILAEMCNSIIIKEKCIKLIALNIDNLKNCDNWTKLNFDLLTEIIRLGSVQMKQLNT